MTMTGRDRWELWLLQALRPAAGPADLRRWRAGRVRWEQCERELLDEGRGDVERLLREAAGFLAAHPGLRSGLVVTFHRGPYALLPALLRWSGVVPSVLVAPESLARVRPQAEEVCRRLGLSPGVEWIVAGGRAFAARMVSALRRQRPLVVYLDGNRGEGGMARTRAVGMPYHLPGLTIRVRRGVGRLASRLDCPVHGACVGWRRDGSLEWRAQRLPVARGEPADRVTRHLFDWMFAEVNRDPSQWQQMEMLAASAACFAGPPPGAENAGAAERWRVRRRWFHRVLARQPQDWAVHVRHRLEIWEPDLLVDRTEPAFYAAGGLAPADLALLAAGRVGREPTLADLAAARGPEWVSGPVCRLYQLGLLELRAAP